jgi:hypothetical protein
MRPSVTLPMLATIFCIVLRRWVGILTSTGNIWERKNNTFETILVLTFPNESKAATTGGLLPFRDSKSWENPAIPMVSILNGDELLLASE